MASSSDVTANLTNSFNNAADTYERRMGTATRAVARHIISSLPSLPPNPTICDNACGTGAITKAFLDRYPHGHVYATDNSPGMVELMRQNIDQSGWSGKVKVEVMDSVRLHLPDNSVDANTMNFGIFFTSDAQRAADEIYRTVRKGGVAVVTCWKDYELFSIMLDVQDIIKPAKMLEAMPSLEKWRDPSTLETKLRSAGFMNVVMEALPVILSGNSTSELVESVAENLRGVIGDQWTAEEKGKLYIATEQVLTNRKKRYLAVDTDDQKGISWTAWIATAEK